MPLSRLVVDLGEKEMMVQTQINFGKVNRDKGMQRAVDHAEVIEPGWQDMAYSFLVNVFLKHNSKPFMTEDFRAACKGIVPDPPSLRAFGPIILKARRSGLVRRIGTRPVKNAKANMAFATVWVRVWGT